MALRLRQALPAVGTSQKSHASAIMVVKSLATVACHGERRRGRVAMQSATMATTLVGSPPAAFANFKFLLMPGEIVGPKRKMVYIPAVQSFDDLVEKIKAKFAAASNVSQVISCLFVCIGFEQRSGGRTSHYSSIAAKQVASPPPGVEAHTVDELWAEVEDLELFDPQAVTNLRLRVDGPSTPSSQQLLHSLFPPMDRSGETPMDVALREDLERRATIYTKGKDGILTGHMKLMNQASRQISLRDPRMVEKGRRSDLMREAANMVRRVYNFKHGYSRSQQADTQERSRSRKRSGESKKWNIESRAERCAELKMGISQVERLIREKDGLMKQAEDDGDMGQVDILRRDMADLQKRLHMLQREETDILKRERRSMQRYQKIQRLRESAGGSSMEEHGGVLEQPAMSVLLQMSDASSQKEGGAVPGIGGDRGGSARDSVESGQVDPQLICPARPSGDLQEAPSRTHPGSDIAWF
eukprot:SM000037S13559  [mRNA]  locus=s37:679965:683366:+ [translate_table: standard]